MNSYPTKKLGEVIEMKYGKGISRDERNPNGKYPIYGANGILEYSDKMLASGEVIIVGRKGSAGEVKRISGEFWASDVTFYVFGNEKIDIDYLFYFFKSVDLKKLASGVKPGINRNRVYEIEIPLPPLAAQKKIVERLDAKLGEVKKARALRAQALAETEKILTSRLSEIFVAITGTTTLGEVGNFVSGGTPKRTVPEYWNGNIPWISSGELGKTYVSNTREFITPEGLKNSNAKLLPSQSLLIGMYDTAALKLSVSKKEITTNQAIIALLPNNKFLTEFFYYQLLYLRPKVLKMRQGVRQQNLNASKIKSIEIKFPELRKQKQIVAELDALSEKATRLKDLQKSQALDLKNLEQAYLRGAFTFDG